MIGIHQHSAEMENIEGHLMKARLVWEEETSQVGASDEILKVYIRDELYYI